MRLLQLEEAGDLSLTEYGEGDVPPYAILSHRWGKDQEEVTFKDLVENTGKDKIGYQKILACGREAAKDGFASFWVDTCCIDKTSSAELSEAINSMWRWYCDSKICYAYLDDVPAHASAEERDVLFAASKWFTRGWTLQELLAPSKLVLFNNAWEPIGTRKELADRISSITRVDKRYLCGGVLSHASIAERMSWASTRETKRSEDIAYCLLGIFDINMPLLYGEGRNAFRRLQEEIMKQSDDHSILAWEMEWRSEVDRELVSRADGEWPLPVEHISAVKMLDKGGRLLAPSPLYFRTCGDIVRSIVTETVKPYAKTNRGLHIDLPVLKCPGGVLAVLNCRRRHDFFSDLALHLDESANGNNQYHRAIDRLRTVPIAHRCRTTHRSMYIGSGPVNSASWNDPENDSCVIRYLPDGYVVSEVLPSWAWSPQTCSIGGDYQPLDTAWNSWNRPILVEVTSKTSEQLLFMMFKRKSIWGRVIDAQFIPAASERTDNIQKLFSRLESTDLSKLSRCQKLQDFTVRLQATPMLTRSKRLVAVDIIVTANGPSVVLEVAEQIRFFIHSTKYHITRLDTMPGSLLVRILLAYLGGLLLRIAFPQCRWCDKRPLYEPCALPSVLFFCVAFAIMEGKVMMWLRWGLIDVWLYGQASNPREWERRWTLTDLRRLPHVCLFLAHVLLRSILASASFASRVVLTLWADTR